MFSSELDNIQFQQQDSYVPQWQKDYEENLQRDAGVEISNDFVGVRNRLALANAEDEKENLLQGSAMALENGADPEQVSANIENYVPDNMPDDINTSLEVKAADELVVGAYQTNETKAVNDMTDPFAGEETNRIANRILLTRMVKEVEAYDNGDTAIDWASGLVKQFVLPTAVETFEAGAEMGVSPSITPTGLGEEIYNTIHQASITDKPKEFLQKLEQLKTRLLTMDPVRRADMLDKIQHPTTRVQDAVLFLDTVPLFIGQPKTGTAKMAGNVEKAVEVINKAVDEGDKVTLVKEALVPTIAMANKASDIITDEVSWSVKMAEKVDDALAKEITKKTLAGLSEDEEAFKIVREFTVHGTISEADAVHAQTKLRQHIKSKLSANTGKVVDVDEFVEKDPVTGTYAATVKLGFGIDGTDAMSYENASNMAKNLGLEEGSYRIVKGDGEGHYIYYSTPVTAELKTSTETGKMSTYAPLRFFKGPTSLSDVIRDVQLKSERFENNLLKYFGDGLIKDYNKLTTKEQQQLTDMYIRGQNAAEGKGKWLTNLELHERDYSENAIKVYKQMETADKVLHYSENAQLVRRLNEAGFMDYGDGEFIGKPLKSFEISDYEFKHGKFYTLNWDTGEFMPQEGWSTSMTLQEFWTRFENVEVVRLAGIGNLGDIESISFVILPPNYMSRKMIDRMLIPYTGGGRRLYQAGTIFIKQGTSDVSSTGVKFYGKAKTIMSSTNAKVAKQYADEVNATIDIYNDMMKTAYKGNPTKQAMAIAEEKLTKLGARYFNCHTAKDLLRTFKKSKKTGKSFLSPEHKVQVISHEGQKYVYPVNDTPQIGDDVGGYVDEHLELLLTRKNMESYKRGHILDSLNSADGFAPLADASEVIDMTVNRIIQTNTINEANATFAREFGRNFMDVIDTAKTNVHGKTNEWLLRFAEFKSESAVGGNKGMLKKLRAAKRLRDSYNLINNRVHTYGEESFHRLFGYHGVNLLDKLGHDRNPTTVKLLRRIDPGAFMRNLLYRFSLGLWNPVQFFKQSTLPILQMCYTSHPIESTKVATIMPHIMTALYCGAEDADVLKMLPKFAGMKKEEFEGLIKFIRHFGSSNMARSRPSVGAKFGRPSAVVTGIDKILNNKFFNSSDMFVNAGINQNYIFADAVAWLTAANKKDLRGILRKADALSLSMSRASRSKLQAVDPFVTQFLTAQFRFLETLMGSKELSKAEKTRILLGNLIMFGGPGTVGLGALATMPSEDDNFAIQLWNEGTLNLLLKEMGYTLQGWGPEAFGFIEDILEVFKGRRGFMQVRAPVINVVNNTTALVEAIEEMVWPETGWNNRNFYKTLATTPDLLKSLKISGKLLYGIDAGILLSNEGDVLEDDFTYKDALMTIFGAVPNKEAAIKEAKNIAHRYTEVMDEHRQSFQKENDRIQGLINQYLYGAPEDPQKLKSQIDEATENLHMMITAAAEKIDDMFSVSDSYAKLMSGFKNYDMAEAWTKLVAKGYQGLSPVMLWRIYNKHNLNMEKLNGK